MAFSKEDKKRLAGLQNLKQLVYLHITIKETKTDKTCNADMLHTKPMLHNASIFQLSCVLICSAFWSPLNVCNPDLLKALHQGIYPSNGSILHFLISHTDGATSYACKDQVLQLTHVRFQQLGIEWNHILEPHDCNKPETQIWCYINNYLFLAHCRQGTIYLPSPWCWRCSLNT